MDSKCTVSWVLKRLNCPRILRREAAQLVSKAEILLAHHKTIKQAAGGPLPPSFVFLSSSVELFTSDCELWDSNWDHPMPSANSSNFRAARATSIPRRTTRQRNRIDSLRRTPRRPPFRSLLMDVILIRCWCPTMLNSYGTYISTYIKDMPMLGIKIWFSSCSASLYYRLKLCECFYFYFRFISLHFIFQIV